LHSSKARREPPLDRGSASAKPNTTADAVGASHSGAPDMNYFMSASQSTTELGGKIVDYLRWLRERTGNI
jgi:hypothetical protein